MVRGDRHAIGQLGGRVMVRLAGRARPTEDDLLALAADVERGERNLAALVERIEGYVARFGIPSSEVHAAIDRGE